MKDSHDSSRDVARGKKWRARYLAPADSEDLPTPASVVQSWHEELRLQIGTEGRTGLRRPQVGAVHALLAYWTTTPKLPATVVMPTGTGKTDTMIATMVAARTAKLLVVVPSDALREQLASAFSRLGVLRTIGLVDGAMHNPIVGTLTGGLESVADARDLADRCNVIITVSNSLNACDPTARAALLDECTHLFIDEAHHVVAPTWTAVREAFSPKPVVQFTATPFRRDGQHLGGALIYAFPLREAQREGYFSTIRYRPVLSVAEPDLAIAQTAVQQLRDDIEAGFDHLLMARVNSIARATEVLALYQRLAPELLPQIAHSRTSRTELDAALAALKDSPRRSRILVCVDMFGEGFDLPQLKIAALHDQHRSLAITMQFIGRFARSGTSKLGAATVIAARGEIRHIDPLRRLYAEDADWNNIVEDLSASEIEGQQEETDFTRAFSEQPEAISIHSLTPATSAVVYQPHTVQWHPERILDVYDEDRFLAGPAINRRDGVAWFVVRTDRDVRWSSARAIEEHAYDLYIVYWDAATGLLYIHSSDNDSVHETLARAITGNPAATPIKGPAIYRVFADVRRLTPTNIGLLDARNRSRRYTQFVGSDVTEAFPAAQKENKAQTHIAGTGFLDGARYTIAGSLKGRVWSHRLAHTLKEWTQWCDVVGPKLIDTTVDIDHITAGFIRPIAIHEWPDLRPLAIEWVHDFYARASDYDLTFDGSSQPFGDIDIEIAGDADGTDLPLRITSPAWNVDYVLRLDTGDLRILPADPKQEIEVLRPRTTTPFSKLANTLIGNRVGLRVLLERDGVIEPPGLLVQPSSNRAPYPREQLEPIDWVNIDLRAESWGSARNPQTVQGRMVRELLTQQWDVVLDDDGSGEVADIVALRITDEHVHVLLVHCKYSHADLPGARVADLYEVVGQAMRSAAWRRDIDAMILKLLRRERRRISKSRPSGFIVGSFADLQRIWQQAEALRPVLEIAIAQPGMSAAAASTSQLQLLASAESWVADTAGSRLRVYCSS